MPVDRSKLMLACRMALEAIGEDPGREGLAETPRRWADWWAEFVDFDPGNLLTTFESRTVDQLVVVSGIRTWSLCEHHLLPFWCDVAIGYIPRGVVLGLSKFARIAHKQAHALQVQERLVEEIADVVASITLSEDVAVIARGEHLCMSSRGVRTPALMTSSVMRGAFRRGSLRAEFLSLARS